MILQGVPGVLFLPVAPKGLIAVVPYTEARRQARKGGAQTESRAWSLSDSCWPEELEGLSHMSPIRAEEYLAGRTAAHLVLRRLGRDSGPVLQGRDGRPLFPENLAGSISHSHGLAAAFVTLDPDSLVGIDIQWCDAARLMAVARSITAPQEHLGGLAGNAPAGIAPEVADLAVRFSIKEAMRKLLTSLAGHAALEVLEFSDMLVEFRDGEALCRPLRPWDWWPHVRVSWAWVLSGAQGPFIASQATDEPVSAGTQAWLLAWVEGRANGG